MCQRAAVFILSGSLLSACAVPPQVPLDQNEQLVSGPQIEDVVTPFDKALSCLNGRINREVLRFSVGAVIDATGKEQLSESGTGKFVTQGAGDIVQSALFQAGVTLVNRRDPRIIDSEVKWGIRDTKSQLASTFFITGSINSLDFLPGSGFDLQVGGMGPRARQHRILVGLDLSMTETRTGRILANVPLQKQIVASEEGFGVGRFFGTTLVSLDMGNRNREALHFAMRQMLNLATFEMLTQLMKPEQYIDCWEMAESANGVLGNTRAAQKIADYRANLAKGKATENNPSFTALAQSEATKSPENLAKPPKARAGNTRLPLATANTAEPGAASSSHFEEEQSSVSQKTLRTLELPTSTTAAEAPDNETAAETPTLAAPLPKEPDPSPVLVPPPRPPAAPVQAAAGPALPILPTKAAPKDGAVCHSMDKKTFAKVTPLAAAAAGDQIRLSSPIETVVCVADKSGSFAVYRLQPNQEKVVNGKAPWRIHSPELRRLGIVYQGHRLRLPAYVQNDLELFEKSGF